MSHSAFHIKDITLLRTSPDVSFSNEGIPSTLTKSLCHTVHNLSFHVLIYSLDFDNDEHAPEAKICRFELFSCSKFCFEHISKAIFFWFLVIRALNFSSILVNISSMNSFVFLVAATINNHNNNIKEWRN